MRARSRLRSARSEPATPRPPLPPVLPAVREGAAGVPARLLFERLRDLPGDGRVVRISPDRLLARSGGEGLDLRGDGLPLRLLARPARDLQRVLLESVHVPGPLPDRGPVRPRPRAARGLACSRSSSSRSAWSPSRRPSPASPPWRWASWRLGLRFSARGRPALRALGAVRRRDLPLDLHRPDGDVVLDRGPHRDRRRRSST